ncbi:conjugative transfer signal peptidase TraF [Vibrio diabolicus]|uniref:conjugative transfer signal peptidase TraF n=1 Tax=Vibrio diabolicus TaxID=50719 RepID=UPI00193BCD35|nr:conjugative transfer signal peptidase TraF [Vibrio diabolicus]EGQ8484964.1 conjugative transfer signal peptidase TraF [Vibrio parahaemolyticus]EGQ9696255.1 conjugative transfer signal peptidase TraF [Vibrio parahaemolyticus]EJX1342454.1 conjugative transfer signal peptidase TraF [Vibrio parahaemolyticus]HCH1696675.1 conjugative transfer signal peptidase TraF [Vibrio parahaemolyticus]
MIKRIYSGVAIAGAAMMLLGAACYYTGVRINTTKSIPLGLYWTSDAPIEKGAYVLFCPPDTDVFATAKERTYIGGGFCPGGYGYMMKRILAAKGDTVKITDDGVLVNGELLDYSKLKTTDLGGRELPQYRSTQYTLGDSELLLMSDVSGNSFDARYFGPVNSSQVETVIRPVFVW